MVESTHWCTIVCAGPTVRDEARSQSLPTPKTHEPALVVFSETVGAPFPALAEAVAPIPEAPRNATTVTGLRVGSL